MSTASFSLNGLRNFLNEPSVKASVKSIFGKVTFLWGILPIEQLPFFRCSEPEKNKAKDKSLYERIKNYNFIGLRCSLILSAMASPIGISLISKVANVILSENMHNFFGPNTIFAVNPWHPRHVISLVAAASAPVALFFTKTPTGCAKQHLLYTLLTRMALVNFVTSRPVLHIGNSLVGRITRG